MTRTKTRLTTPGRVREAVLALRRMKSMVVDPTDPNHRSVGSFFVNPVLSPSAAEDVVRPGRLPGYHASSGRRAAVSWAGRGNQVLGRLADRACGRPARVPPGGGGRVDQSRAGAGEPREGSTEELLVLAAHVQDVVREVFGVCLEPEPAFIGFPAPPLSPGDR